MPLGISYCPRTVAVLLPLVIALVLFSFVQAEAPAAGVQEVVDVHRIVVIGDIHGDPENFKTLLKWAELVKEDGEGKLHWAPRDSSAEKTASMNGPAVRTTLVQLGDLTDRGEDDMQCLDIAMTLQEQALKTNGTGEVVLLIGNHELMNLQGQYHYVHRSQFGGFLTKPLRDAAFRGAFGQYIIDNFKIVHVDEDIVFVHAGFTDPKSLLPPHELNKQAQEALRKREYNHPIFGVKGPVWTRKMIQDATYSHCDEVAAILAFYNATTIVVGHTPQRSGQVETFCGGQVIAADVGISRWMYNNVEALDIEVTTYRNSVTGEVTKKRATYQLNEQSAPKRRERDHSGHIRLNDRDDGDL